MFIILKILLRIQKINVWFLCCLEGRERVLESEAYIKHFIWNKNFYWMQMALRCGLQLQLFNDCFIKTWTHKNYVKYQLVLTDGTFGWLLASYITTNSMHRTWNISIPNKSSPSVSTFTQWLRMDLGRWFDGSKPTACSSQQDGRWIAI